MNRFIDYHQIIEDKIRLPQWAVVENLCYCQIFLDPDNTPRKNTNSSIVYCLKKNVAHSLRVVADMLDPSDKISHHIAA